MANWSVKKTIIIQLPWLLWLIVIAVLSFIPGDRLPDLEFEWFKVDTFIHVIMYLVLIFFMQVAFFYDKNELFFIQVLYSIVICLLIGYGIELIQGHYIKNRFFSWSDVISNGTGAILGSLAFRYYRKKDINLVRFLK